MCDTCGCHAPTADGRPDRRLILEISLLDKNRRLAERNRAHFTSRGLTVLNLMSAPGSGKTRLLESTLPALSTLPVPPALSALPALPGLSTGTCAVIEGDLQTERDAERIRATGTPAVQINTGKGCHLEADAVFLALAGLPLELRLLFIENVGNLVCPAAFDLGESHRVVLLSVTEGEDKPLKYPDLFVGADLVLLTKIDLLPYLDYDLGLARQYLAEVAPGLPVLALSARSGEGMERWMDWLCQTISATPIP